MLLLYYVFLLIISTQATKNFAGLPNCAEKEQNRRWILVNTLEGKLTALNYDKNGEEIWNFQTGPGSMLSSNIDRLELSSNANWVRIIPSLSGSLYKFNGDTIDAIPINAESLLTTSFKYLDDLVIAGGREVRTYGVVLDSGQILYECTINGCKNKTDRVSYEDLILVERNTQTVRAIEPRSGIERWNFSVGQLDIKFPQSSCHYDINEEIVKFNMKAVVPEGLVYAFGENNQILWKKQFLSPIVNVWTWDGKVLKSIDLFSSSQYTWSLNTNNISPALYVGMYNKQLYIHESVMIKKLLTSNDRKDKNAIVEVKSVSQIPWKPFPAKSSALAIVDNTNEKSNQIDDLDSLNQTATTALSVLYASEYVNGHGFYLYTSDAIDKQNSVQCEQNVTIEGEEDLENETIIVMTNTEDESENDTPVQVIIVSLWYWWKEVALIAITSAFALNYLLINQNLFNRFGRINDSISATTEESNISSSRETVSVIPLFTKSHSESSDKEFPSRYLSDFITLHCLGKGGFGVVFEARNILDECSYAVKRITLPNNPENRDRVMREAKALAKLDHRNIVRYFQAWVEAPPSEWIENFDREWKCNVDPFSEGLESTTATKTRTKLVNSSVVINLSECDNPKMDSLDFKQLDDLNSDSFIVFENSETKSQHSSEESQSDLDNVTTSLVNSNSMKKSMSQQNVYNSGKMFLYIQMQLCQKVSLRDWLKNNTTRNRMEIKNIFEQIISAVEYVHSKGLIHRDLKPSNIFFSMDGEVKIGDFGLVTGNEECNGENSVNVSKDVDKHTQAVGTQLYMSPEQLNGLKYNFKVDIYSLGVILFELLMPFYTEMERIKTLSDLRKNQFPDKFKSDHEAEYSLLLMMLSEKPDRRPTTQEIQAKAVFGQFQ